MTDLVAFARALDQCWLDGRFADVTAFVAPDVVYVAPGGSMVIEGRSQAVESYRSFVLGARVISFEQVNHRVTERGDAAVVEYDWEMAWEKGGEHFNERGRDILVLSRRKGSWRLVWRTQLPL